jgi:hypothetical protein
MPEKLRINRRDQVAPHNISRTRTKIAEAKDPSELFLDEHSKELAQIQRGEHPAYQYRLVIEFYPVTGYWVLFREQAYKPEYGGDIIQEMTAGNIAAIHETSQAWANTPAAQE